MLLSVTLGAALYIATQFFWYSPLVAGKRWLSLRRSTPEKALSEVRAPDAVPESFLQILAPAFLMSAAIHALAIVLGRFGQLVFFFGVAGMFVLTAGPKYLKIESSSRSLALIGDGALLLSLTLLAVFVLLGRGTLY